MHKKDQGSLGEHIVITEILKHQLSVFKDVGDNSRFDLVVYSSKNELLKIQVKCLTRHNGATCTSFNKYGPNYTYKYTEEDVDWFAIVDLETFKVAWLEYKTVSSMRGIVLRHTPPKNGQKNVHFFDDYTKFPF